MSEDNKNKPPAAPVSQSCQHVHTVYENGCTFCRDCFTWPDPGKPEVAAPLPEPTEKCKSCFKIVSATSKAGLCKECVDVLSNFKREVSPIPEIASESIFMDIPECEHDFINGRCEWCNKPAPLGEAAHREVWLVEFRSDIYPNWRPWHFEFYDNEEDAEAKVKKLLEGKAISNLSRSEFRSVQYAALASKAAGEDNNYE